MSTPELIAEQREAAQKRRAFARSPEQSAAQQLEAAFVEYERMRAEEVSQDDACQGLALVLRDVFPPSPYVRPPVCSTCEDIGWIYRECPGDSSHTGPTCGRRVLHGEHSYVTHCHCELGQRIAEGWRPKRSADAAIAAASKPRGFSRVGRR